MSYIEQYYRTATFNFSEYIHAIPYDGTQRNNPILKDFSVINQDIVRRVFNAAIPFLNMYRPTGIGVSVALGAVQTCVNLADVRKNYLKNDWTHCAVGLGRVSLVVSSVAMAILIPNLNLVLSQGYDISCRVCQLVGCIRNKDFSGAGKNLVGIAHNGLHMAANLYAAPELLALSLLMQGLYEIYRSYEEYKNDHKIEWLANIVLALIRFYQSMEHIKTSIRNHFGESLTQYKLQSILDEINDLRRNEGLVDFNEILKKHHYSGYLKDLEFKYFDKFSRVKFQYIIFDRCVFDQIIMKESLFESVRFYKCTFNMSLLSKSIFRDTAFMDCTIKKALFDHTQFWRVIFSNCQTVKSDFNDALLTKVSFVKSILFEISFLSARVSESELKDCDLTDSLLFDTKEQFKIEGGLPNKITRPVVAIAWNYDHPGSFASIMHSVTDDFKAISLAINYEPKEIDIKKLEAEVGAGLKNGSNGFASIGEGLIKNAQEGSQIGQFVKKANEIARHIDALVLPGGEDIEPELYGQKSENPYHVEPNYRRSIYEFAMISEAKERKIPILGICRGSQIVNVFFGGTLKQDVPGQFGWSELSTESVPKTIASALFQGIAGNSKFFGLSMHHQASDQIGKGLVKVLERDGVTKALISEDGNFILTQFHPEAYTWLDESDIEKFGDARETNKNILAYFFSKASFSHLLKG